MKLNKHVSIAAASLALTIAAVSTKPAQAASVNFLSQSGGTYNYNVLATSTPSEKLIKGSSISLSGLVGVTNVTGFNNSFLNLVGYDANNVFFTLKKATANVFTGNAFTGLDFSVISSSKTPGSVSFSVLSGINFNSANTTGPTDVPEPMTIGGSLLAVGLGAWMKRKKAESAQNA